MHGRRLLGQVLVCLGAVLLSGPAAAAQQEAQVPTPEPAPERAGNAGASVERVIGEVTAADPAAKRLIVKTDAGSTVTVILQDETLCLRVPPGETDLKKAVKIAPAEIGVGDRVYARGALADDQTSMPALAVIVMTKGDLAQKRQRERAEWQKRAVAGTIAALKSDTQEITLSVSSREGTRTLIVESSQKVVFRRYAPDSVRFGQAKPSSFAELKVGDSLRILGERSADGTRITPEEIVSGSFRNIAGVVTAIDVAAGEIRMTDLQSNRPLTVRIGSDTVVRRLPPAKTAAAPSRPQEAVKGAGAPKSPASGGRPTEAAPTSVPPATTTAATANRPQEAASSAGAAKSSGSAKSDSTGSGGQIDVDRMPALSLGDLKRGEALLVMCTVGAEPSRVTAIVMVAGIEPLLGSAPEGQTQIGGIWNFFDISVP